MVVFVSSKNNPIKSTLPTKHHLHGGLRRLSTLLHHRGRHFHLHNSNSSSLIKHMHIYEMGDYPSLSSSSSSLSCASDCERVEHAPPLSKVPRYTAWERRQRRQRSEDDLTDEDLKELKGCIELGFGFNAEDGQRLCTTIPALDLYFAVNRHFFTSPLPSPGAAAASIPTSPLFSDSDSRKILSPGDDPQQVKTKLRHWAQAVACSVMQSPTRGVGMD